MVFYQIQNMKYSTKPFEVIYCVKYDFNQNQCKTCNKEFFIYELILGLIPEYTI